jgi:capsular exopolysaccharide synthesis family protein
MNEIEQYGLRPQVAAALQADGGAPEAQTSLGDLLHVLRKRKGTILGLTAGTLALTAALTLLQTPIYQAKARLIMQLRKGSIGMVDNSMPLLNALTDLTRASSVSTEVEVLQSNNLVDRAIVEADSPLIQRLRRQIAARDRRRNELLAAAAPPAAMARLDSADRIAQVRIESQAQRLMDERHRIMEDPNGRLPKRDPKITVASVKDTEMMEISAEDPDRARAANTVNSLAANYLDQNRELNSASARKGRQFVEASMEKVQHELLRAELAMRRYKEHTGSIDLGEETKQQVAHLADLNAAARTTESEYKGLQASEALIERQVRSTPGILRTSTTVVRNPVIGDLEKQVAGLEVTKAGLLKEYTPDSPEVQAVDAQLAEARTNIAQAVKSQIGEEADTLNPVHQELLKQYAQIQAQRVEAGARAAGLKQAVAIGQAELQELPSREQRLAELTRNAAMLNKTYALLNEKYQELKVSEAAQLANARIIDAALMPQKPIRPKKGLNLALGLGFGLLLGLAIAFLQEHLDNSVKTPDQMEREFGLPTLGMLGDIRQNEDRVISSSRPQAALAEALRMVRASLQFASVDGQLQSLLVTSAVPGEGKSTIAANLALVMAQKGLRVVLVDADMRSPRQHRIFQLSNTVGLSSVIVGQSSIEDAAHIHPDSNLMILTSGPMPPNPAELLESARARDLVQQLKASCDMVVFDSPPCTTMVDGSSLAAQVDGAILVVRAGHTSRIAVARACQVLRETGTRLLGTILNRVSVQTDQYYYYTYYNRYYYSNYGEPETGKRPALARSGRGGREER